MGDTLLEFVYDIYMIFRLSRTLYKFWLRGIVWFGAFDPLPWKLTVQ